MSEPSNTTPEQDEVGADVAPIAPQRIGALAADLRCLIEATRRRVAQTVNAELVMLNWQIGNRIRRDILAETRAGYGEQIVSTLSRQLTVEYGAGFSRPNLFHMIRFVEAWPDENQIAGFSQHLGWSYFKAILYLEDQLARQFYGVLPAILRRGEFLYLRSRVSSFWPSESGGPRCGRSAAGGRSQLC